MQNDIRITSTIHKTLQTAAELAEFSGFKKIATAHVFYALSQQKVGQRVFQLFNLPVPEALTTVLDYFQDHQKDEYNDATTSISMTSDENGIVATTQLQQTISIAAELSSTSSLDVLCSIHLFASLVSASKLSWITEYHRWTDSETLSELLTPSEKYVEDLQEVCSQELEEPSFEITLQAATSQGSSESILPILTFSSEVLAEKLTTTGTLIGRTSELQELSQIVCHRTCPCGFLLGESGSGKTAILTQLEKHLQTILPKSKLFCLDPVNLILNLKTRAEIIQRFRKLHTDLQEELLPILIIDNFGQFFEVYSTSDIFTEFYIGLFEIIDFFEVPVILTISQNEHKKLIQSFPKFESLQTVQISQLSKSQLQQILVDRKPLIEQFYKLTVPKPIIDSIVQLGVTHLSPGTFPGQLLDTLDLAATIDVNTQRKKKHQHPKLRLASVYAAFSKQTKLSVEQLNLSEVHRLKTLEQQLQKTVFGQDEAIRTITSSIFRAKAGLADEKRPIGSFLFSGPTGVGKTETARQLAQQLNLQFIRLDMSEFSEQHSTSKLIGSPPGYVGYRQPGALSEQLKSHPDSVILFDEIEKAHENVHSLLLQIFDYGKLTLSSGEALDFTKAVIILTSNAGVRSNAKPTIGFGQNEVETFSMSELKLRFAPELRNRLDAILVFNSLEKPQIFQIVEKLHRELDEKLKNKNVRVELDISAKEYFVRKGYQPEFGARPLTRLFQTELNTRIAEEVLYGRLQNGGIVHIREEHDSLIFSF